MKKNVLCLALLLVSLITVSRTEAQEMKYYDAGMFTMVGKGLETERMYHRVDTVRYGFLEPTLKRLLTNSVGLAIAFKTDSRVISARWEVKERASGDLSLLHL